MHAVLLVLAGLLGKTNEEMRNMNLPAGRTSVIHANQMISKLGAHGLAQLPFFMSISYGFKRIDSAENRKPADVTFIRFGRKIIRTFFCHTFKRFAFFDPLSQGYYLFISSQRICRISAFITFNEDMAGIDFHF